MNELVIIVEGPTEQFFVRNVLAGHLAIHGVAAWAVLPGKHRSQGGVRNWVGARRDVLSTIKEGRYCTTMFDYYGMPKSWPGRKSATGCQPMERATLVEQSMARDIANASGSSFNPTQFIPYVQLHEFEALLFSNPTVLGEKTSALAEEPAPALTQQFQEVLDVAGAPEAINDGRETCPSARIIAAVPAYGKRRDGPIIASAIGLPTIRDKCPHFNDWITRLESLMSRD
ncbi:MAG: DUF4276 family protein [Phycisphaerae bacterium]